MRTTIRVKVSTINEIELYFKSKLSSEIVIEGLTRIPNLKELYLKSVFINKDIEEPAFIRMSDTVSIKKDSLDKLKKINRLIKPSYAINVILETIQYNEDLQLALDEVLSEIKKEIDAKTAKRRERESEVKRKREKKRLREELRKQGAHIPSSLY
jgi:hypothetical protein